LGSWGNVGRVIDEFRSPEAGLIGSRRDSLPGLSPGDTWRRFGRGRPHVDNAFRREFKLAVFLKNFKRGHVVPVVILPAMHESGRWNNSNFRPADFLAGTAAGRQSNFIKGMRNRALVRVPCGMRDLKKHGVSTMR
jgi:hypothetical protein